MRSGDWTCHASRTAHRELIIAYRVSYVQPRKKHKLPNGKNVFFSHSANCCSERAVSESQPAHAPQADAQGGEIVQRGGGGWRQDSGYAQSDQRTIEADDKTIIGVDARH